jgi:hypothetical protein
MTEADRADEQAAAVAAEAAGIGGKASDDPSAGDGISEAERPLIEGGEGEAEGFETAEEELIDHASHGDQHAARRVIQDAPDESADARGAEGGEADEESSSERDDEKPGASPG